MDSREIGIAELIARLKAKKTDIGLARFIETPSGEVDPDQLPAILLEEGPDQISSHSNRSQSGYPSKRVLEISFECIVDTRNTDTRTFCRNVRRALFLDKDVDEVNVQLGNDIFVREDRTEGPFGYGLPNVNGMRLILNLIYTDEGIII